MRYYCVLIAYISLICSGACELGLETREKYVNEFLEYLNNLPNQQYVFEEGALVKYETVAEKTYKIEANIKVSELNNADTVKFLLCSTTIVDLGENGVSIQNNEYQCLEPAPEGTAPTAADDMVTESLTTEDVVERRPLQLDNEIQSGNYITSGEQFVAIRREQPAPCIGCSTRVDPQADGVNDLAVLAIRHLDRHEPAVRHTLISVVDVERQVQVVNGVRYILTLTVDYNNCTEIETEDCNYEKPCKITVLEKPWVKLRDGSKYRAILANNCTADWLFGDNGEVMPQNNDFNNENNEINLNPFNDNNHGDEPKDKPIPDYDKIANTGSVDDILKVVHKSDLQAQQGQEKENKLTDEQMRNLQEQIIPLDKFKQYSLNNDEAFYKKIVQNPQIEEKDNVGNSETEKHVSDSALPVKHPVLNDDISSTISEDKKKAIDELMNFFSFAGMDTKIEDSDTVRIKRSYDPDLKTMNLVNRFQKLKGKLQNAKYLLTLGQSMVDYLNEMDMEVKNRVLNDVTAAEEESENNRQFVYLQARVSIPCEKAICEKKDLEIELCNAIMDTTKRVSPQVLDAFCVAEEDKKPSMSYPGRVEPDDPVLNKLAELAVNKIESESPYPNAFRIRQILSGVTQKLSGTLTMISVVLEFIDCNKTVPHAFRSNCSTIYSIGTKVCEIQIHQRPEFREKSITYTCTDRPADESFSSIKYSVKEGDVNDPKVIEVAHEALQYLEVQSNNNNKPKIVEVTSVSSKLVAGMLTNVKFVVGYTTCTNDVDMVDINSCSLIESEPLRLCEAQVWDRPWLEDGRQMKVSCKIQTDKNNNTLINNIRQKRSPNELSFVGGQSNKDTNDKKFIKLAKETVEKYTADSGINLDLKVVKLTKVTVQVVAGSLTRIEFEITPSSNCVLNTETTLCDAMGSESITTCQTEVRERLWLKKKEIKINCQDIQDKSRKKRSVPGGEVKKDSSHPKYKALAEESLLKYLQSSGNQQEHEVILVNDVFVQSVSGTLTKLNFIMSPKNCENCKAQMYDCHSEVWERVWLKSKEITVSCKEVKNNSTRKRRDADDEVYGPGGGGISEVDPTLAIYQKLARKSLDKYMETSGITEPHKVVNVTKVTFQVVSGTMTRIDFIVTPGGSKCVADKAPSASSDECEKCGECKIDTFDCHSEVWEQAWLNKTEITVNCTKPDNNLRRQIEVAVGDPTDRDPSDSKYETLSENKSRKKRSVLGGEIKKDLNDPTYKALAEESLLKYIQSSGNQQEHKVIQVNDVLVQVVPGKLTKLNFTMSPKHCENCKAQIYDCHSEVWERAWLKSKEITVSCKEVENNSRRKRSDAKDENQAPIVGGISEVDPTHALYQILARKSLDKYMETSGITEPHNVVDITKVTIQVVSGSLTRIDFIVAPGNSKCVADKAPSASSDECEKCGECNIETFDCHSEVWERAWLNKTEITVNCTKPENKLRHERKIAVGGETDKDPSDPKYKALAEESLAKHLQTSGKTDPHKIVKVEKVTVQVVSGTLTNIHFTVSRSNSQDVFECDSIVWEQPWLEKKEITIKCQDAENSRDKRALFNGETINDLNDPKFKSLAEEIQNDKVKVKKSNALPGSLKKQDATQLHRVLAEESLKKYQLLQNSRKFHKVIEVNRVITQTVSGIKYKVEFTAAPTSCSINALDTTSCEPSRILLYCHSEIWDRPWLKRKEIDVVCNEDANANNNATEINTKNNQDLTSNHEKNNKKQNDKPKSRSKRDLGDDIKVTTRDKRQVPIEDDLVDDDVKYYYAQMVVDDMNVNTHSQNLEKLITIHDIERSMHMRTPMVRMYIETAKTFCLRDSGNVDPALCDEIEQIDHRICLARIFPSPDDELVVLQKSAVCDDDYNNFLKLTGIDMVQFVQVSIDHLEQSPDVTNKLYPVGAPHLIPSLRTLHPMKVQFVVGELKCPKTADIVNDQFCVTDTTKGARMCTSFIWMKANSNAIRAVRATCRGQNNVRKKRSLNIDTTGNNETNPEDERIKVLVQEALEQLEMSSLHRYKQRVLLVNSYSTKITSRKVTTIDFDVGYTSCLKYEWVENVTNCEFLEHLPRRHCVAQVWEKLWTESGGGKTIEVNCEDDETPLEAHIEFESAENAMELAREALKHIEAKYPHPRRQKVVRIFSLEKQSVAGLHYRLKMEVGFTDCPALSVRGDCRLVNHVGLNKFCRVNVWIRPWTDHPPTYRVACDYQESTTAELYHQIQAESLFSDFLMTYKPDYMNDDAQLSKRFEVFKANVRKIQELNIYERGTARYAVTRFSDLSTEEFRARYLGLDLSMRDSNAVPMRMAEIPTLQIPDHFDWREFDAVTEVKDQGACGSCWAFSVTGNIEGQWKMQSGQLVSLSEQELVDCDKLDNGCNGGLPDNAYRAIEQLGGLELETDYPYEGEDDKCAFNKTLSRVQISGAVNITSNETEMATWLVQNGPISIGINANAMQFYVGGVSHPWKTLCNPKNLDHGVLIVGYGVKDYPLFHKHLPYWIVKNSWGKSWGEQGYYRVYRGDGTCGVNMMASSAVV